jgi:hypothetical protein
MKKYQRTAVMAVLMAGVVASLVTGSGHADTSSIVLFALLVVTSTSSVDYWRDRCRRAENEDERDKDAM